MSRAVLCAASPSLSTIAMSAPPAAKRSAIARPIPRAAPVINAALFASRPATGVMFGRNRSVFETNAFIESSGDHAARIPPQNLWIVKRNEMPSLASDALVRGMSLGKTLGDAERMAVQVAVLERAIAHVNDALCGPDRIHH